MVKTPGGRRVPVEFKTDFMHICSLSILDQIATEVTSDEGKAKLAALRTLMLEEKEAEGFDHRMKALFKALQRSGADITHVQTSYGPAHDPE